MSTITALKPRRGRIDVYLDGVYSVSVDTRLAEQLSLAVGLTIDDQELRRLRDDAAQAALLADAQRFLSYRPRSVAETEQYLRRRGADDRLATAVVARLQHSGLLDDALFARFWVENRAAFSPRGARQLQAELRAKGVHRDDIDGALSQSNASEDESAHQAGMKRLRLFARLDEAAFHRRMHAFLLRRGFDHETARTTAARLWTERDP